MERELIELLRGRLPADEHEIRLTSRGVVLRIGRLAMGVNVGLINCSEMFLDKAAIDAASKHIDNYDVREHAKYLPAWVVEKPALMWDSDEGLVLLDGRQRTGRLFADGHDKVRVLVIPNDEGRRFDIKGGAGMFQPANRISERLQFATMSNPLPAQYPGSEPFGVGAVLLQFPDVHAEGQSPSQGNRPKMPEYYQLESALIRWLYDEWVKKDFMQKRSGQQQLIGGHVIKVLLTDIAQNRLTIFQMGESKLNGSIGVSIRSTCRYDGAVSYRHAAIELLDGVGDKVINDEIDFLSPIIPLIERAMIVVALYTIRMRALYRIVEGKGVGFSPANLAKAVLDYTTLGRSNQLSLAQCFLVARFAGVDMTAFYWGPPCVRTLSNWWAWVNKLETFGVKAPLSPAMCETFLQRLAMKNINETDLITEAWELLFTLLRRRDILQSVEQMCWRVVMDPLSYHDLLWKRL